MRNVHRLDRADGKISEGTLQASLAEKLLAARAAQCGLQVPEILSRNPDDLDELGQIAWVQARQLFEDRIRQAEEYRKRTEIWTTPVPPEHISNPMRKVLTTYYFPES